MSKILLAADGFVTAKVLEEALFEAIPGAITKTITSDWPQVPFHDFGGVKEACGDEDSLIEALKGCEVCFTHTWPITRKVMEASPDLKLVTVCRGGPVNADIKAASELGITVTFTPGRNAVATAEHTVAMLLAAARQIPQRDEEVKDGQWRSDYYQYEQVGPEVRGSTVGVIGFGAVGAKVGHILAAMGAKLVIFDPWLDPSRVPEGAQLVSDLNDLFRVSNFVTIHARVTEDNYHMVGREQIDLLPDGAILVNCARGSLLDYDAAADALEDGRLFAAAFDCLPQEPLPAGHRLLKLERVVLTPHLGGASKQAAHFAADVGAKDIARFLKGETPKHCMNCEN